MLVLTRKVGEVIVIGDEIRVEIIQIKGKQVRIGIEAPKQTPVYREEVLNQMQEINQEALNSQVDQADQISKNLKE